MAIPSQKIILNLVLYIILKLLSRPVVCANFQGLEANTFFQLEESIKATVDKSNSACKFRYDVWSTSIIAAAHRHTQRDSSHLAYWLPAGPRTRPGREAAGRPRWGVQEVGAHLSSDAGARR